MLTVRDVCSGRTFDLTLGRRLGEGAQGEVFEASCNGRSDLVLKKYRVPADSAHGRHLMAFCRYLDSRPSSRANPLNALPEMAIEVVGDGAIGCLVPRLQGEPLDDGGFKQLAVAGLQARLSAGYQLSSALATLHDHLIVHSDVMEHNVALERASLQLGVLDVDGGGVLRSPLGCEYHPDLAPLVRGRFEGSAMPPELFLDADLAPSLSSDGWFLAVLLHKLLLGGLDPFFFVPTYGELLQAQTRWPPAPSGGSFDQWVQGHCAELARLGPALRRNFTLAFNRTAGGLWAPRLRPRSGQWASDLEIAGRWVMSCSGCREELVAAGVTCCPFCGSAIPHAQVWTSRRGLRVDQDRKLLIGQDLNFSDHGGRYEVVAFGRRARHLLAWPKVPLRDLATGHDLSPGQPQPHELRPGRYEFRAFSRDGQEKADFRVLVPA